MSEEERSQTEESEPTPPVSPKPGDTIIAEIGDDVQNVVVGKNVIQIGTLSIPYWVVALILLALLLILGFVAYPPLKAALTPEPPPPPMTGKFNIAVARFGEMDERGRVQPSDQGALLSQWVADKLGDEFDANQALFGGEDVVETLLLPDSFSGDPVSDGMVQGDTPEERQANAAALAKQLNAHMLIYGNLIPAEGGSGKRLALEFYISPFLGGEARELAGHHALGDPAPVNLSGAGDNPLENIAASSPLETRTAALVGLTTGLIFDLVGDHDQALDTLIQLDGALKGWKDEDGKELLYFMIARQRLFLDQLDEAEAAARQALAIDPDYVRANIVLGSVYAKRAVNQMKETQQPERENVAQAVAAYEAAVDGAADETSFVGQIARMSLALGYLLQAQSASLAGETNAAIQVIDQGLAELEPVFDPLEQDGQFRYLAQAYQYRGNAHFLKADVLGRGGDREGRRENLSEAQDAYAACIEQGDRAPADATLQGKVIDAYCRPMLATTEEELAKLEESP